MIKKIFAFAITSGLAAQALRMWMDRERSKKKQASAPVSPVEVQRWENEGGMPADIPNARKT